MFKRSQLKHESPAQPPSEDASSQSSAGDKERAAAVPLLSRQHLKESFRRRRLILLLLVGCLILIALGLGLGLGLGLNQGKPGVHKGPNVLVIMTDDQDQLLDSMTVMPKTRSLIGDHGVNYLKHYCTVAWCCPSRVNFFTGRAAHNTNVTATGPPYGGWQKFSQVGLNNDYLPTWISAAGINTYYLGKFMNGFGIKNLDKPAPPNGWTNSSFLVDPWTYNYYHSHWTNGPNNDKISNFKGIHTTDVIHQKALDTIDQAVAAKNQFFMMVAPVAPHQELAHGVHPPPVPAKYRGKFSHLKAPRSANWNPDEPSGASWVRALPKLNDNQIKGCDNTFHHRLGNLAAIDDMVEDLVNRLDHHGVLDNTYIVYTTDNGFHIGNHRLKPGKRCPYEEDINIPLLIRGPDVAKGVNTSITNSHTDMAPTILKMLGLPMQSNFDGAPVSYTHDELSSSTKHEIVNVEFWNAGMFKPIGFGKHEYFNNTYKALRLSASNNESYFYSTWCDGSKEFYDMNTDSVQMNNLLLPNAKDTGRQYYGRSQSDIVSRLDALLMVTKGCKEESCRDPWSSLFPGGQVSTIQDAMDVKYDNFFNSQPKVSFSSCHDGNVVAVEGPQSVNAWSGS